MQCVIETTLKGTRVNIILCDSTKGPVIFYHLEGVGGGGERRIFLGTREHLGDCPFKVYVKVLISLSGFARFPDPPPAVSKPGITKDRATACKSQV